MKERLAGDWEVGLGNGAGGVQLAMAFTNCRDMRASARCKGGLH